MLNGVFIINFYHTNNLFVTIVYKQKMSQNDIVFNPKYVVAVNVNNNQCRLTFPKPGENIGTDYVGTYNFIKGQKEFEECMRVYKYLKNQN